MLALTEASKDTLLAILKAESRLTAKAVAMMTSIILRDFGSLLGRKTRNGLSVNGAKSGK